MRCPRDGERPGDGGGRDGMSLTVGSCFSGIGGIEKAFERHGFETAWQVEIVRDRMVAAEVAA